ncbi:hypothetical protein C8A06_1189 [Microbacteriaceae bacterium MWH-Ta3]|nr:hypothetical protein C8A06_1189 [Microbacteriaceae bacterium MWH-Ta3]
MDGPQIRAGINIFERQSLLVLTSARDGTADRMAETSAKFGTNLFRFNFDLWDEYEISVGPNDFQITDPTGRSIYSRDRPFVLERKPTLQSIAAGDAAEAPVLHGQLRGIFRHICAWAAQKSLLKLVDPWAEIRLPKLFQLKLAIDAGLRIPESRLVVNTTKGVNESTVVVKPLEESQLADGTIWYTSVVAPQDLNPVFPWFQQSPRLSGQDVTCVYVDGKLYFYICSFNRSESSPDWRVEINTDDQSLWRRYESAQTALETPRIEKFMRLAGLHFGRLDFILDDDGLWFLEVNPNGQFGWLDTDDLLLNSFWGAVLSPSTTVAPLTGH